MLADIRLFTCNSDNFGVLLHDSETGATAAIDAPELGPIEKALEETGWKLTDILITHHHPDHTAAIEALKAKWNCRVVAPKAEADKIPGVDETVVEGDEIKVGNFTAEVIETPGHTAGHIVYWFPEEELLFAADTLFSLGCGRLMEKTAAEMWPSILKLRALSDDARLYCGHEYTQSNAKFALSIDPDNEELQIRAEAVDRQRAAGEPTVPTLLGQEKRINPFMRADDPALAEAVGLAGADPVKVFAEIRKRKDNFR